MKRPLLVVAGAVGAALVIWGVGASAHTGASLGKVVGVHSSSLSVETSPEPSESPEAEPSETPETETETNDEQGEDTDEQGEDKAEANDTEKEGSGSGSSTKGHD